MSDIVYDNVKFKNIEKTSFGNEMSILASLEDFVIAGNELWFSNALYNGILKLNMKTGEITYVLEFEEINEILLSTATFEYKNKIYFFPSHAKYIYSYEITKNQLEKIELPQNSCYALGRRKYQYCLENNNICLALPYDSRMFLIFNKKEENFEFDGRWYDTYKKRWADVGGNLFIYSNVLINNNVYMGLINSNKLMRYDLISGQCDFMEPIEKDDIIVSLCNNKDNKWLISANGVIARLDEYDEISYEGNINFNNEKGIYFSHYYSQIDSIVILTKKNIFIYSVRDKKVKIIEYPGNGVLRCLCKYTEGRVFFDLMFMESIWFFDIINYSFHEIKLFANKYTKMEITDRCILTENSYFRLKDLFQVVEWRKN